MDFEQENNEEKWGPICPTQDDSNEPATTALFFY